MTDSKPPFEPGLTPDARLKGSVARNRAAQDRLERDIAALAPGPLKRAAEARLLELRTSLLALNVEMQIGIRQRTGEA